MSTENELKIPRHIAIILDGNGRWAAERHLPRKLGHKAGCETLEQIVEDCARLGVGYLTVYAFSTENWKRSEEEVGALMSLFRVYLKKIVKVAMDNNVRVQMIGDCSRFDADIREGISDLEEKTGNNTGMTFVIAINYGSRDEITRECAGWQEMRPTAAFSRRILRRQPSAVIWTRPACRIRI